MKVINRWNECYEGQHQQTPPNEFKQYFCNNCMNTTCELSRGGGLSWTKRMSYQVDRLLDNPNFADERNPEFQAIRNLDFKELLDRELKVQISKDRGDWSVPSDLDVSMEASRMLQRLDQNANPMAFQPPKEEPKVEEPKVEEPVKEDVRTWTVKGGGSDSYVVTCKNGGWTCTCPSYVYNRTDNPICKHILRFKPAQSQEQSETETKEVEEQVVTNRPPPIDRRPALNTEQPTNGIVIGGSQEQPKTVEPQQDDWSVPTDKPNSGKLKSGMRFSFKK